MRYLFFLVCGWAIVLGCQSSAPSLPDFDLAPGFELSLVAQEPVVVDPVDMAFSASGQAYVLQMPGYPFEDRESRIVQLWDDNQDGQYDRSTVLADSLRMATSLMTYGNSWLVAAPPFVFQLWDEDHDGRVDRRDTLLEGLATDNLQHNANGLTLGLDGWIYVANGGNDGAPHWKGRKKEALPLQGHDFRFHIRQQKVERWAESSGGFELAMDAYGRWFTTHNLTHISHVVVPSRYIPTAGFEPLENISDHDEHGLARIYPVGEQEDRLNHPEQAGYFSGACGIMSYTGGAMGKELENSVWVADVVLNLLHVDVIHPKGSSFVASRYLANRDLLASSDRSFRPVNQVVGPDGAIYVLDMHRAVIEHPEWIPDEIEKTLDLSAGKEKGRIYRLQRKGYELHTRWDVSKRANWVKALQHPNAWVRMQAHQFLSNTTWTNAEQKEMEGLLRNSNPMARLHALWLLTQQRSIRSTDLQRLTQDPDPGIRENAFLCIESLGTDYFPMAEWLVQGWADADPRVARQAALTSSLWPEGSWNAQVKSWEAAVKKQKDPWTLRALAWVAQANAAQWMAQFADKSAVPLDFWLALLPLALDHTPFNEEIKTAMAGFSSQQVEPMLTSLGTLMEPLASVGSWPQLNAWEENPSLVGPIAVIRKKMGMPPSQAYLEASEWALQSVQKATTSDSARLIFLKTIRELPYKVKSQAILSCLHPERSQEVQEEVLRQLLEVREASVGRALVAKWPTLSPSIRKHVGDLLLYVPEHHGVLMSALEAGHITVGEMNFDLERRRTLLWWTPHEEVKRCAKKFFSDTEVVTRKSVVEAMKPALQLTGVASAGQVVFQNSCSGCHQFGRIGQEVGPNLTEISRKSKATLLREIVDPNAAVDPKYIQHKIELKNGQIHWGIIAHENDRHYVVKKMGGESVTILKRDIQNFRSLGTSLMMEGLEASLSHQQMADLLAYLQTGL